MELEAPDLERLVKVETSAANIEKLVIRMDGKLDGYAANHVSKSEMQEAFRWRDEKLAQIIESQRWLGRMLATAVTGGIVSLVIAVVLLWTKDGGGP